MDNSYVYTHVQIRVYRPWFVQFASTIRRLLARSLDYRAKRASRVCTTKSADDAHPHFAHTVTNIYTTYKTSSIYILLQMVWEQSCEMIIMLTEVVENGKVCIILYVCHNHVHVY